MFCQTTKRKKASQEVCDYVDSLISTWNPQLPQNGSWQNPKIHPCSKYYLNISANEFETDYVDVLSTVLISEGIHLNDLHS